MGLAQIAPAVLVGLAACSAYDSQLLPEDPQHASGVGGSVTGGATDGGATAGRDAATDAGRPRDGGDGRAGGDASLSTCGVLEACNGLDDDCDDVVDEDGTASCAAEHATTICSEGTCLIVSCEEDYRDCDNRVDTGCEVSIADDAKHCGGCDAECRLDQTATAACGPGYACAVDACSEGFGNCDGDDGNGCETSVRTPAECGGCAGTASAEPCEGLPHVATSDCATGRCRVTACDMGFQDCDDASANGCETPGDATACGCDASADADADGSDDCADECDADPAKTLRGECGCGLPETDSDADEVPDCIDLCDDDPLKDAPGQCGCGASDGDADADGTADCDDGCPADPTLQGDCFPFGQSNFDAAPIDFSAQPSSVLDCGDVRIDTSDPDGAGPAVATITGWCGTAPSPLAQAQTNGPDLVVIPLRGLTVASGTTLTTVGPRPVVLAVRGDVTVAGSLSASASGTTPGAGGNWSCTPAPGSGVGENGTGAPGRWPGERNAGASGGGGGGFGTAGGNGGTSDTDNNGCGRCAGGRGGATRGGAGLVPLVGGCGGGRAGGCSTAGGAGGGALQITASGTIRVSGTLRADGADGSTPCGANDEGGGTGGGSGGGVLLEASDVDLRGASLSLDGGRGGRNGSYAGVYGCGNSNGGAGSTGPSSSGGNGGQCQGGGSGGGGGYGRLHVEAASSCSGCP